MIIHFLACNDWQVQVAEPAGALALEGKNLFSCTVLFIFLFIFHANKAQISGDNPVPCGTTSKEVIFR